MVDKTEYKDLMEREGLLGLMQNKNPFEIQPEETDKILLEAMAASFNHHFENNPTYQAICMKREIKPDMINSIEAFSNIPLVASTFFRGASAGQFGSSVDDIASMPADMIPPPLRFTTSGTTSKTPSIYPFDPVSMNALMTGTAVTVKHIYSIQPEDYVLFLTCAASMTGMTQGMTKTLQKILVDPTQIEYAMPEVTSPLDAGHVRDILSRLKEKGTTHIYGPPYAYNQIADDLIDFKMPIYLGDNSLAMTTGGWKSQKEGQITEDALRQKMVDALGIDKKNHRDGFGLTDIFSFFPQCDQGYFHIPPWIYVSIRDPNDMYLKEILEPGQTGQIAFMNPVIGSFPGFIATGDIGTIVTPRDQQCGCGRYGGTFQYLGRQGLPTGCALVQESQQKSE